MRTQVHVRRATFVQGACQAVTSTITSSILHTGTRLCWCPKPSHLMPMYSGYFGLVTWLRRASSIHTSSRFSHHIT